MDEFVIYYGYGQIMHRLQVFEIILWGFKARRIKAGASWAQSSAKIDKWNATTLGQHWRAMKSEDHWPAGMVAAVDALLEVRNWLAHHFLREYALIQPSEQHRQETVDLLRAIADRVDNLVDAMEAHARAMGLPSVDDLSADLQAEIQEMRPTSWSSDAE